MIYRGRKVLDGTLSAIQGAYGADTIRLRAADGAGALEGLEGVEKVTDHGKIQELRMVAGCDSQQVLRAVLARTPVDSFEIVTPSLQDIFVRIAGPEAREAQAASAGAAPGR